MEFRPILLSLKHNKFMAILTILQIALTMTVLSVSVLKAWKTLAEWNLPSGIPHEHLIRVESELFDDSLDVGAAMARDLQRLQQHPQVLAVTRSNDSPFMAEDIVSVYTETGESAERFETVIFDADEQFTHTLQLQLRDGRFLNESDVTIAHEQDGLSASVVMISEDMAKALFNQQSAIGKTLYLSREGDPVQIVGVYSNFMVGEDLNRRGKSYWSVLRPQVIYATNQEPQFIIRVAANDMDTMIEEMVSVFYQEQGRYVVASESMQRSQKRMYDGRGSRALTELILGCVLMLITAAGIAGLTSFQVNQRRQQIGARRALGARKSDILRYFLLENALVTWFGLAIGIVATFYLMFEISVRDDENYLNMGVIGLISLWMWLVSAVATWIPAHKATLISPSIVTRGG